MLALVAGCDFVFRLDAVPAPAVPDAPPPIIGRWVEVVAGLAHTCALDDTRHLWCWGQNNTGELGIATMSTELDVPRQITEASWTAITARNETTCGVQEDGSLWCWGANASGEVGTGSTSLPVYTPTLVDAGPWLTVSSFEHTCAVRADHTLWCWGLNDRGQVGDGTQMTRPSKVQVAAGTTWDAVSTGSTSTCAIASDRSLWCWGGNNSGQLGLGMLSSTPELLPRQVSAEPWLQISVGRSYACGITGGGQLRCWGINNEGQLGDATTATRAVAAPVIVGGEDRSDWEQIATGDAHACARSRDAGIWCWGSSARDQLGIDMTSPVATPVQLLPDTEWLGVATGESHTCAVARDHTLWCLGADGFGQLGDAGSSSPTPAQIPGAWNSVALGNTHMCALGAAGAVSCTGLNASSQLGIPGLDRQQLTPLGVQDFVQLEAGSEHTCGVRIGEVWCWGLNGTRQIGTTSASNAAMPTRIRAGSTSSAYNHTCTIDPATKHMWCWGNNDWGQVGNKPASLMPTPPPVATPFEIPTITWRDVGAGRGFTCGVTTANTLTCWGDNGNGQLASGNMIDSLDPASGAPGFTVDRISVGGFHLCALSTAGALTCWGADYNGQLGIGVGSGSKTTPQSVPGTWLSISAGYLFTCGIQQAGTSTTEGTLWCWGDNARGQLGDGTRVDAKIPVQVGMDADWAFVYAGYHHTCAIKSTGGAMWCWGDNSEGQLGTNTAWRTDAVQVP